MIATMENLFIAIAALKYYAKVGRGSTDPGVARDALRRMLGEDNMMCYLLGEDPCIENTVAECEKIFTHIKKEKKE